jgi:hypothetical protein
MPVVRGEGSRPGAAGDGNPLRTTIELVARSPYCLGRRQEPVSVGVPFSRGRHAGLRGLGVIASDGRPLTTQWEISSRWPDGSVRWARLDFVATLGGGPAPRFIVVEDGSDAAHESDSSSAGGEVTGDTESVIDTGVARFTVSRTDASIEGRLARAGAGIRISFVLTDLHGSSLRPRLSSLTTEAAGPVRITVRVKGDLGSGLRRIELEGRISFFPGTGLVLIEPTLRNGQAARHRGGVWDLGDPGSVLFRDFALHAVATEPQPGAVTWSREPGLPKEGPERDPVELFQESSGGENWGSRNHVNRLGSVPHRFRGYRLRAGGRERGTGWRAQPVMSLETPQLRLSGTVEHFWENFPKAIEGDARALRVRLFPSQYPDVFELQGGEQKTHRVWLQLEPVDASADERPLEWVPTPLVLGIGAEWYAATGVVPQFCAASADGAEHRALLSQALSGPHSFDAKRETIDEYGWRHFGDVYADHENAYFAGARPVIAHYNNQYDLVHGFLLEFLRSGDRRWFELGRDLARHVVDIDIYHTQHDRPEYSGGLFWHTDHYQDAHRAGHRTFSSDSPRARSGKPYGGGPSNEHNYTSGLLLYYYLTGDRLARDAVLSLAGWVRAMDDGRLASVGVIDAGPTGRASATHSMNYHGPGRGAGNSVNALLDAFRLTGDCSYCADAERLIRRCIHPSDDQDALALDDLEARWSYLVFLQVLGKYLDVKSELGELDAGWAYARGSLLAYAAWMLEREVPYAKVLDRTEYPTETWPAHDLRKSEIFGYAAKYGEAASRPRFLEASSSYFQAAFEGLARFETRYCTRPLAIVLQSGATHAAWRSARGPAVPAALACLDWGRPSVFEPQAARVLRRLRSRQGILVALRLLARPSDAWRLLRGVGRDLVRRWP